MPTCQLVQLQARMSEKVREKRISKVVHPSTRSRRGTRRREERKLKQLKEITQMMKERQLREGATPEEEAEEAPYTADWEGYPDETYPEYGMPSRRRRFPSVILEEPDQAIPTAEELAERMEKEEEDELADDACINEEEKMENNGENEEDDKDEQEYEDDEYDEEEEEEEEEDEDDVGEDQPCLPKGIDEDDDTLECLSEGEEKQKASKRRQITFSDHRHVFHYPKGGAVGCKYEEEEEEEHEKEEEEEGNEEDENADEDSEEEEEEEIGDEEEEDQHNEERQGDTEEKEEEDPLMEAESLGFNDDVECEPEEQEVDLLDFLQSYQPEETVISNKSESPTAQTSGTLRMRHKKQKVKK